MRNDYESMQQLLSLITEGVNRSTACSDHNVILYSVAKKKLMGALNDLMLLWQDGGYCIHPTWNEYSRRCADFLKKTDVEVVKS